MMPPRDYQQLATLLQTTAGPLINKLSALEEKVDRLNQDRVTRTDIEKLRSEMLGSFVPRDAYEPRHAALIERDAHLENMLREVRKELLAEQQEIYGQIKQDKAQLDQRFDQLKNADLSEKDRVWVRWSQILGAAGIIVAVLDWLSMHIRL